jgi:hypothetical protein
MKNEQRHPERKSDGRPDAKLEFQRHGSHCFWCHPCFRSWQEFEKWAWRRAQVREHDECPSKNERRHLERKLDGKPLGLCPAARGRSRAVDVVVAPVPGCGARRFPLRPTRNIMNGRGRQLELVFDSDNSTMRR